MIQRNEVKELVYAMSNLKNPNKPIVPDKVPEMKNNIDAQFNKKDGTKSKERESQTSEKMKGKDSHVYSQDSRISI